MTFNTKLQDVTTLYYCGSFKPCYKWMTFNTLYLSQLNISFMVLNLVINGWPSIPWSVTPSSSSVACFKPCYKWMTFNTQEFIPLSLNQFCFKPCYKWMTFNTFLIAFVLSILCFKPCYKWMTFNTEACSFSMELPFIEF